MPNRDPGVMPTNKLPHNICDINITGTQNIKDRKQKIEENRDRDRNSQTS